VSSGVEASLFLTELGLLCDPVFDPLPVPR
jgi:hypothetical protein